MMIEALGITAIDRRTPSGYGVERCRLSDEGYWETVERIDTQDGVRAHEIARRMYGEAAAVGDRVFILHNGDVLRIESNGWTRVGF